ncbi:DUF5597 domain-containing protein [Microbacterium kribbense]
MAEHGRVRAGGPTSVPSWRLDGTSLLCDGVVTLLVGGQVHNSSASSPGGIAQSFRRAREVGGNTVIAPAYWDLSEPTEGTLDFALVDVMLGEADRCDLRLVLLWFGAFKNAGSTYAPRWVRADVQRFPRARALSGIRPAFTYEGAMHKPVLSVFAPHLRNADARAFEALMTYVARHPLRDRVALVQIENEVGLLGDSRDRSDLAEAAWNGSVPAEFVAFLREAAADSMAAQRWRRAGARTGGSWAEVLGESAESDEIFMAWAFATYVEALATRGAGAWPVPFYVNAWLGPQPGQDRPGQYPSGGPGTRVLDVWRAAAPTLSMMSPDIYIDDAASTIAAYAFPGNPLFVPECRLRAGDLIRAISGGAIGWSAFGIDDARAEGQTAQLLGLFAQLEGQIARAQREGRIAGIVMEPGAGAVEEALGGIRIVARATRDLFGRMLLDAGVARLPPAPESPAETIPGARIAAPHDTRPLALVIALGADEFLIVGEGITLDFCHDDATVEIDSVVAGTFVDGQWMPGLALNGDERLCLLPTDEIGVVRVRLLQLVEE